MISVEGLAKRYGSTVAVDDLTFDVGPGKVTGFLAPNAAGKSTTMRMVMGLDRPTSGTATVNGRQYAELAAPLREVGAVLDAGAMHPGRSGQAHLRIAALATASPSPAWTTSSGRSAGESAGRRAVRGATRSSRYF